MGTPSKTALPESTRTEVLKGNGPKWTRRWPLLLHALREALQKFYTDDSLTVSASIAYYSVLSIFPFLLLLLGLSGLYIRHYQLTGRLTVVLTTVLPMQPDFIVQNLEGISRAYGRVGFASFLLLWLASAGVFLPVEKSLNRAWDVQNERTWLRRQILALEMALIFGSVFLASSSLVGLNVYLRHWLHSSASAPADALLGLAYRILIFMAGFLLTLGMFVILFQRLPNRPMRFRQILPSAFVTAILWHAARSAFTFLLTRFNYRHVYGSIGAMVALMTWAYISSAVMLFGARVSGLLYRTLEVPEVPDSAH
ncbi:MAG: hypothetical protein DMG24_11430 [Acidobacteria bacterium]|nr:MAG: hypothetical protein DMG24_11430 [Acidobacteriota bacterium]